MLDFYLDTEATEYLGGINAKGFTWLQKNHFLKIIPNDHSAESVNDILSFHEDTTLNPKQVMQLYTALTQRTPQFRNKPGFKNEALDTLEEILRTATQTNQGVHIIAD